jgi:hypothetical protein
LGDPLGVLGAHLFDLAGDSGAGLLGFGLRLLRGGDLDLRRLVRDAGNLFPDQRLAGGCVLAGLFEFGLRLCFGLRPVAGMLLAQPPGLLGQPLARPRLDAPADLFEAILRDRLVAVGAGLSVEMEMRLDRGLGNPPVSLVALDEPPTHRRRYAFALGALFDEEIDLLLYHKLLLLLYQESQKDLGLRLTQISRPLLLPNRPTTIALCLLEAPLSFHREWHTRPSLEARAIRHGPT